MEEVFCCVFLPNIWNLIDILRVSRSENRLTVYRALDIIQKQFGGGQGAFRLAPFGDLDKKRWEFPNRRKF